jgi:hypothetical protein
MSFGGKYMKTGKRNMKDKGRKRKEKEKTEVKRIK